MHSIARRTQDGLLAFVLESGEPDLIGTTETLDTSSVLVAFDPDSDVYLWSKVFGPVYKTPDDGGYDPYLWFTPDGSKILLGTIVVYPSSTGN